MVDLIDKANKITEFQKNLNISATEAKQKVEEAEKNVSYVQNLLPEKKVLEEEIKKLPTIKIPELVKKQKESAVLTVKTEADRKLQELKETGITDLKTKLKDTAVFLPKVPSLPKLPLDDARVLATLGFIKKVKEIRDKKQQESVENIKKSKEAYTFSMKKVTTSETSVTPTVPNIPTKT